MNGETFISTPWSEPWVAWTMLGLLVLAAVSHALQPQAIPMGFRSLFSTADRNSLFIDSALDKRGQVIMVLFAVGVLSLAVYRTMCGFMTPRPFAFITFAYIVLAALVIMLLRTALEALAGFTFVPRSSLHTLSGHYYHLLTTTAILHYLVLLICLFWSALTPIVILVLNAVVVAFFYLTLLIKSCLLLVHSFRGLVYTLIAFITLEIVPFAGLLGLAYIIS